MSVAANVTATFGLELFQNLVASASRGDNVVISTYGILSALSLLMLGTKGKTEENLSGLFKIKKESLTDYHQSLSRLASSLASPTLSSANRLFVRQNLNLVASFLNETTQYYGATAAPVEFGGGAQAQINEWVKAQTRGKIPELLAGPLDPLTAVFLVNAVYYKDKWRHRFEHTYRDTFHVSKEERVYCNMMMLSGDVTHTTTRKGNMDQLDCQLLELPYAGDFSMLIILPNVASNLPDVEKRITGEMIREGLGNLRWIGPDVDVYLPRFKIEFETGLEGVLKAMGVSSLFDSMTANLTGMIEAENVAVSNVIHKAVIEVNEEGTEAAAVTGIRIYEMSGSIPFQFKVDHPFLFAIVHKPTATPIFLGRVTRPSPATVTVTEKKSSFTFFQNRRLNANPRFNYLVRSVLH